MHPLIKAVTDKFAKSSVPVMKPGYDVRVHQKIKEGNKERVQVFQGMVIAVGAGYGTSKTFTVRKISDGIGVEKTFPAHSPNIVKIEVMRAHKVRRAKLGFLRSRSGRALRLKEVPLKLEHDEFAVPMEEVIDEAPVEANEVAATAEEAKVEEKTEEVKEEAKTEEAAEGTEASSEVETEAAEEAPAEEEAKSS